MRIRLLLGFLLFLAPALAGCVVVQPYEREFLADTIMQLDESSLADLYEQKMLETREGGLVTVSGAAPGCGCK